MRAAVNTYGFKRKTRIPFYAVQLFYDFFAFWAVNGNQWVAGSTPVASSKKCRSFVILNHMNGIFFCENTVKYGEKQE
jgi:hypothetical protein